MALELSTDLVLGVAALLVAVVAIFMFMRATSGVSKPQERKQEAAEEPLRVSLDPSSKVQVPTLSTITKRSQVEEARSKIRTLTLQQEILSLVMKRLFEAEDNGEISREEREKLSKNYEGEMKGVTDELDKAELIVSLNDLEEIRSNLIAQFQETLADTQTKIDLIIKELKIEQPKPETPKAEERPAPPRKPRRARPRPSPESEEEEEAVEEEAEEEAEEALSRADTVEDRLDRLKKNVLKELEELDKLELEAS
jgi:hypothetical protein